MSPDLSVLLLDDDEMIAESFRVLLEDRGYRVDVVRNVRDAFGRLSSSAFDLIFIDPFMSGAIPLVPADTITQLRRLQPHAKLVVLTWYGTGTLERCVKSVSPSELLQKPQSLTTLAAIVEKCVSGSPAA
jgi:DNA-binding NtrC family response regulator